MFCQINILHPHPLKISRLELCSLKIGEAEDAVLENNTRRLNTLQISTEQVSAS